MTQTETAELDSPAWWGEFDLATQAGLRWRIGPLTLAVINEGSDWVIAQGHGNDPIDPSLETAAPCSQQALEDALERARYALESPQTRLRMQPRLADRPVGVRPDIPVSVPSGQAVTFYISTPVWLRISVLPKPIFLTEIPTFRPSDSWFGSTHSGELCYGTRSRAKLKLADLDQPAHRAVTPVRVVNKASEALAFDRLKLPMPNLALYRDADGRLVTQAVEFVRESAGDSAIMRLSRGSGDGKHTLVDEPRIRLRANPAVKAFDWALGRTV